MFENKFSPRECIFEFLKLPISQSLALNIEAKNEGTTENAESDTNATQTSTQAHQKSMDHSKGFKGEYPAVGTMTVFNDSGNPLLSQVAIFARLLE